MDKFRRDNIEEIQVASIRAVEREVQQIRNLSIDSFGKNLRDKLKTATKADKDLLAVIKAIASGKLLQVQKSWNITGNAAIV